MLTGGRFPSRTRWGGGIRRQPRGARLADAINPTLLLHYPCSTQAHPGARPRRRSLPRRRSARSREREADPSHARTTHREFKRRNKVPAGVYDFSRSAVRALCARAVDERGRGGRGRGRVGLCAEEEDVCAGCECEREYDVGELDHLVSRVRTRGRAEAGADAVGATAERSAPGAPPPAERVWAQRGVPRALAISPGPTQTQPGSFGVQQAEKLAGKGRKDNDEGTGKTCTD